MPIALTKTFGLWQKRRPDRSRPLNGIDNTIALYHSSSPRRDDTLQPPYCYTNFPIFLNNSNPAVFSPPPFHLHSYNPSSFYTFSIQFSQSIASLLTIHFQSSLLPRYSIQLPAIPYQSNTNQDVSQYHSGLSGNIKHQPDRLAAVRAGHGTAKDRLPNGRRIVKSEPMHS